MITGPEGHADPVNHVLPAWDIACGLYAAVAILGADRRRRMSEQGMQMRVALHDVALAAAGNLGYLAEAQLLRVERKRHGNYVYGVFARDFTTRDGRRIMLVALTKRHWTDLLHATGLVDVAGALEESLGVDFGDEGARFEYREVLAGLLAQWFSRSSLAEVESVLAGTSVLWSIYHTFIDLVADEGAGPKIAANPMIHLIDQPGIGAHLAPGLPVEMNGAAPPPEPAPLLGEHTDALLDRLGLSGSEIADLHRRGVVRGTNG
jgi:2-methylfumaryl-CoA isomerase